LRETRIFSKVHRLNAEKVQTEVVEVYGSELISSLLEEQLERDRELALLSYSAE
jgi:hypothetical protein